MSSAAATVSCQGLPRTRHRLPFPTSGGLVLEHRHLHLPAWGCHPNHWPEDRAHIPWAAAHGYSPGGPAPPTAPSLPSQLHPISHSPLQP